MIAALFGIKKWKKLGIVHNKGMDFYENLRAARQQAQDEADKVAKQKEDDKNAISDYRAKRVQFLKGYGSWANKEGSQSKAKGRSDDYYEKGLDEFIRRSGEYEGAINAGSSEADIARYGAKILDKLSGELAGSNMSFEEYVDKRGTKDEKALYRAKQQYEREKDNRPAQDYYGRQNPGFQYENEFNELKKKYESSLKSNDDYVYDLYENYDKYTNGSTSGNNNKTNNSGSVTEESSDTVTFTLPRANDPEYGGFAQKIIDLGLATDKGLWGSDGDVAFYTQQLYDQGALDANGNLKIGTPIKLKRRKV